jgi:hypothetical protein
MKKAILIICVLSVLALLVVPVVAGVLSSVFGPEYQIGPTPRPGGGLQQANVERPTQIAGGRTPPGFNQS